jgi:hypothetical protein
MEHIREPKETEFHPDNINMEKGFSASRSQKPLIQTLRKQRFSLWTSDIHPLDMPFVYTGPDKDTSPPSLPLGLDMTLPALVLAILYLYPHPRPIHFTLKRQAARSSGTLVT